MRGRGVEGMATMAFRQPTKLGPQAIVERWRAVAPSHPIGVLAKQPAEARWTLRRTPIRPTQAD